MITTKEWIKAIEKLNELLDMVGYNKFTIVDAEKQTVYGGEDKDDVETYTIKDIVDEARWHESMYHEQDSSYWELKEIDIKQYRSELGKWKRFITKYSKYEE